MMRRLFILGSLLLFLCACGAPSQAPADGFAPAEEERLVVYTSHREAVPLENVD